MLVKPVKSQTNLRQQVFLDRFGLKFERLSVTHQSRFAVHQRDFDFYGHEIWKHIGDVFTEKCTWVFVPIRLRDRPYRWYFGLTRTDAVAGYFIEINGAAE